MGRRAAGGSPPASAVSIDVHDLLQEVCAFLSAFRGNGFNDEDLNDSEAIMMHDALLNLNGQYQVQGASGTLSFSSSPAGAGNPHGKLVPVLQFPVPPGSPSRQVGPLYITP
ncbi:MAG: hypothetical protein ACRDQ4_19165 [Pseudonocardiaceae bacterium]